MARTLKSDAVLFAATLSLVVVGLTWVYGVVAVGPDDALIVRQGMWVALGVVGMLIAMRVDYHLFCNRKALLWVAGAVTVGLVVVLLFGHEVNGGKRWIRIASVGTVQPSEFAKLVAILFVAAVIARRMEDEEPLEPAFVQAGTLVALFAVLILAERDIGTTVVLVCAAAAVMFVAGLPYRWVLTGLPVGFAALAAIVWFLPHAQQRVRVWRDPWADPLGAGYQIVQSLITVGTGGVWGRGFGHSVQKLGYLPEAQNDYIFAIIAEEMGLVGASVLVLIFAVVIVRGLLVAKRAPDAFGSLVAIGITAMIGIQSMVNIGVVINLLPSKGIPLPFVSAGGSSMIVSLVAMGVLLNISQQASATE
jgi:cell division protein FtsW